MISDYSFTESDPVPVMLLSSQFNCDSNSSILCAPNLKLICYLIFGFLFSAADGLPSMDWLSFGVPDVCTEIASKFQPSLKGLCVNWMRHWANNTRAKEFQWSSDRLMIEPDPFFLSFFHSFIIHLSKHRKFVEGLFIGEKEIWNKFFHESISHNSSLEMKNTIGILLIF